MEEARGREATEDKKNNPARITLKAKWILLRFCDTAD